MNKTAEYIYSHWDHTLRYTPNDEDNIIGLPYKFTSPSIGELHSALFYWDTYFANEGLILSDKLDYAISNTECIAYLINKFGYMPNGNRTHFIGRSQPPFFYLMIEKIYDITGDREWLSRMVDALIIEWNYWNEKRNTEIGLARYYHSLGPIETANISNRTHARRRLPFLSDETREEQYRTSEYLYIVCESGWDCNSRMGLDNKNYAWIDLNSLLWGMEDALYRFSLELSRDGDIWKSRRDGRAALIRKYLWNSDREMFCDYDYKNGVHSDFLSVASFYPLFVGMATEKEARLMREKLSFLEFELGLSASENREDLMGLQWDWPVCWAPLVYIAVKGLDKYGYTKDATRIAKKYAALVERAFEETGDIWEKYDITTGKPAAKEGAERKMMGWSAGIYLCAKKYADEHQ